MSIKPSSQTIQWAPDFRGFLPYHVGVNHGGIHMLIPQQLLDCPDIVARFKQMRCKAVKGVWQFAFFGNPAFITASFTAR